MHTGQFEFRSRFESENWVYVVSGNEASIEFDKQYTRKVYGHREASMLKEQDCLIVRPKQQYSLRIADNKTRVMIVSMKPPPKDPDDIDDLFSSGNSD